MSSDDLQSPRVRDVARLTITDPSTVKRRRRPTTRQENPNGPVTEQRVHPEVLKVAKAILRPGERILVVSPTEVLTVPDGT